MPTKLNDIPYPGPRIVKRLGGLSKSCLVAHQGGTICFPSGSQDEFGCGASLSITRGAKRSLSVKVPIKAIEVQFGQEYEWGRNWSYQSGKCEWCSPEICYPNSKVSIWKVSNWFKKWLFKNDKYITNTTYGTLAGTYQNCKLDARCNCTQIPATSITSNQLMEESDVKNGSLLIVPHSFTQRNDITMTSNLQDTVDDIHKIINADIEDIKCSEQGMVEGLIIGILNPSGSINWIYRPTSNDNKQISLLSTNLKDLDDEGQGIINLDSTLLPVLAATSDFPNSKSKVSLDIYDPDTHDVLGGLETDGQVSTRGLFTIVWKEFDLSEVLGSDYRRRLKDGSIATVKVSLSNNRQDRHLTQKYKVLLPPNNTP